jgi:uncharacterized protein YbcI
MTGTPEHAVSPLSAVSNAMVTLHKEQFGRGPTTARSGFAGPDTLICVLEHALLPAELKMVEMGEQQRVRESRMAFQVATATEFVAAVEQIVGRKVRAFSSALDADKNVVFENFVFESRDSGSDGNGAPTAERAAELGQDGQIGV